MITHGAVWVGKRLRSSESSGSSEVVLGVGVTRKQRRFHYRVGYKFFLNPQKHVK